MAKNTTRFTNCAKSLFQAFFSRFGRLLIVILALLAFPWQAYPTANDLHQKRTHAVSTIVLGIISYARWASRPNPICLCVTASPRYTEGLFDRILLKVPHPIKAARLTFNSPRLSTHCDVIYLGYISQVQKQNFIRRISGHSILSISENDIKYSTGSIFAYRSSVIKPVSRPT